jgi:hypothetical protein
MAPAMFHRSSLRQAHPKNLSKDVQNIGSAAPKNWAGLPKNWVSPSSRQWLRACRTCNPCLNLYRAPPTYLARAGKNALEAVMNHWRDTMVDRPEPDGAAYVTGWTISGIAVLATIVTVWVLGI